MIDVVLLIQPYTITQGNIYLIAFAEIVVTCLLAFGFAKWYVHVPILAFTTALLSGCLMLIPSKSAVLLCLVLLFLFFLLRKGIKKLFIFQRTRAEEYKMTLRFLGEEKEYKAFMDSGNRLRLPGSFLPVIVADERLLEEWYGKAKLFCPEKLVCVPYHGVAGKGLLKGVRLELRQSQKEVFLEAAVVMAEHSLFHNKEYQMLLQPEAIQEQNGS